MPIWIFSHTEDHMAKVNPYSAIDPGPLLPCCSYMGFSAKAFLPFEAGSSCPSLIAMAGRC
eukprot:c3625_g1_i1 orf=1-180(-)